MSSRRTEKYTLDEYENLNANRKYYVKNKRPDLLPIEIIESLSENKKLDEIKKKTNKNNKPKLIITKGDHINVKPLVQSSIMSYIKPKTQEKHNNKSIEHTGLDIISEIAILRNEINVLKDSNIKLTKQLNIILEYLGQLT